LERRRLDPDQLPLFTFEREYMHECGYRHKPGEVTHLWPASREPERNPHGAPAVAGVLWFVCNGCHDIGGKWFTGWLKPLSDFDHARGRNFNKAERRKRRWRQRVQGCVLVLEP